LTLGRDDFAHAEHGHYILGHDVFLGALERAKLTRERGVWGGLFS
jgi:hypothetical protein